MSTAATIERTAEASPRARMAGVFYLLTFATGIPALFVHNKVGLAAGLIAGACYIAVTLLFYYLFKPVNPKLSLLAAIISLTGCIIGPLGIVLHAFSHVNALVFFGFYCLLIGYLIFESTFLPHILGALMAFAGLGWLMFISPSLASNLSPWNMAPGLIGEGALTMWLLVKGVNEQRWREQARAVEQWRS